MLLSYLKVALRVLRKHRGYALLNVAGLAIGLACAILVLLTVRHDHAYDRFHRQADRTFRVLTVDRALGVSSQQVGMTIPALGPALVQTFPEVREAARLNASGRRLFGRPEVAGSDVYADDVFFADSTFFRVFDFALVRGDTTRVLREPATVVLTESLARRLFGDADPMGQTVRLDREDDLRVVGVAADPPGTSHLRFDALIALFPTEDQQGWQNWLSSWNGIGMLTYVVLDDPASAEALVPKMEALFRERDVNAVWSPALQPLTDVHLRSSGILFDVNAGKSDVAYVRGLGIVGLLVLLIAAFNFMNLATARSAERAKEVGIRKVSGAMRSQLVVQHLGESFLLCGAALVLALGLVAAALPTLAAAFDRPLTLAMLADPGLLVVLFAGTVLLALLAGSYPALVLSGFRPAAVLKGTFARSPRGEALRKGLVVTQFAASVALIVGTLVVSGQLAYVMDRNMGYNREQVVVLGLSNPELQAGAEALREALEGDPLVRGVARSNTLPGRGIGRARIFPEGTSDDDTWIVSVMNADDAFLPLLDVAFAEGRNFSRDYGTDAQEAILLNEAAVRALGWTDAVGREVRTGQQVRRVVGVVRDFHFASVRHQVEPLVLLYNPNGPQLSIRLAARDMAAGLASVEQAWKRLFPEQPFEYSFLSDEFAQLYREEQQLALLSRGLAGLAILIACLGLFGLAAYAAQQRRKEIGVRKVLGAGVPSLVGLLSKEFLALVAVAFVLGAPVAYLVMSRWLEGFAYRTTIGPTVFLVAGGAALLVAVLAVSGQALRAATADPVNALRSE